MNERLELAELGKPLVATTAEIPAAPASGYIVKVLSAGICGTDANLQRRGHPKAKFPWVLGHEIAGIIHDIGAEAAKSRPEVSPGARVVVFPWTKCGVCPECTSDRSAFCRGSPPFYTPGIAVDGGFQQYVSIHHQNDVYVIPESVDLGVAAIASCSGLTSWNATSCIRHAVDDNVRIRGSARILIIGAGGLGLWGVEICRQTWSNRDQVKICVVDTVESKLGDAQAAGADIAVTWEKEGEDAAESDKLKQACGGLFDAVIDYSGVTSTMRRVLPLMNTCGVVALCGMSGGCVPETAQLPMIYSGTTIQGVLVGSRVQFTALLQYIQEGKLRGPPIERVTPAQVNDVLPRVAAGAQRGRAVLTYQ